MGAAVTRTTPGSTSQARSRYVPFPLMCAVRRTSSEPEAHSASATAAERDAVLYEKLMELVYAKHAELHLVTGPATPDQLAPLELARLVPDIADRDVFVCGPPGMTNAVLGSLRELGVPKPQIHFERFSLAG